MTGDCDMAGEYYIVKFGEWIPLEDKMKIPGKFLEYVLRKHTRTCAFRSAGIELEYKKDAESGQELVMAKLRNLCNCSYTLATYTRIPGHCCRKKMTLVRYREDRNDPVWTMGEDENMMDCLNRGEIINFEWINLTYDDKINLQGCKYDYDPDSYTGLIHHSDDTLKCVFFSTVNWDDPKYKDLRTRFSEMRKKYENITACTDKE